MVLNQFGMMGKILDQVENELNRMWLRTRPAAGQACSIYKLAFVKCLVRFSNNQ